MPAKNPQQKRLACMALGYKRHGESVLRDVKNKKQVIDMANSMTEQQLEDYCKPPVGG